jgi:hypothetical protein
LHTFSLGNTASGFTHADTFFDIHGKHLRVYKQKGTGFAFGEHMCKMTRLEKLYLNNVEEDMTLDHDGTLCRAPDTLRHVSITNTLLDGWTIMAPA